jgi:hypothetical protein
MFIVINFVITAYLRVHEKYTLYQKYETKMSSDNLKSL